MRAESTIRATNAASFRGKKGDLVNITKVMNSSSAINGDDESVVIGEEDRG